MSASYACFLVREAVELPRGPNKRLKAGLVDYLSGQFSNRIEFRSRSSGNVGQESFSHEETVLPVL